MSFFDWINPFRWNSPASPQVVDSSQPATEDGDINVRRWDASYTDRLNAAQFERVTGRSINEDLVDRLPKLMQRCEYEASVNPIVYGIIDTHAIDIVGPTGPLWVTIPRDVAAMKNNKTLQAEFAEWSAAADELLSEWFAAPDLNGEMSGVEVLCQDIYHQWVSGNSLVQFTSDSTAPKKTIQARWNPIHPCRVMNEAWQHVMLDNGEYVTLGIHRTKYGRKLNYRVAVPDMFGGYRSISDYELVKASDMVHRYRAREAGQIVGVPVLAAALPVLADLRQYDKYVMEAAKLAASFGIVFEDKFDPTKNPGSQSRRPSGTTPVMRGGAAQVMHAPPNKEAIQIDPKQPHGRYVEFRSERLRDVGRAAQMPLLLVRLGAEEHSFASARFDAQIYQRSIRVFQQDIVRKYGKSLDMVLREAELIGLLPRRPVPIEISAVFSPLPHVDPAKEAKAMEIELDKMVTTLPEVWREQGRRPEDAVNDIRKHMAMLDEIKPGSGDAWFVSRVTNAVAKANDPGTQVTA